MPPPLGFLGLKGMFSSGVEGAPGRIISAGRMKTTYEYWSSTHTHENVTFMEIHLEWFSSSCFLPIDKILKGKKRVPILDYKEDILLTWCHRSILIWSTDFEGDGWLITLKVRIETIRTEEETLLECQISNWSVIFIQIPKKMHSIWIKQYNFKPCTRCINQSINSQYKHIISKSAI